MPPEKHVYGPVPSRRLGLSLGVDLVPFKTCPYDCIYCQLGATRRLSCDRETFTPVTDLVDEVRRALGRGPAPDVITLAGSGEPTLYRPLGQLIAAIQALTTVPVMLLTNGALFWDPEVRRDAARCDGVLPSLDAGDERRFQIVNRPHPSLTLERVLGGLEAFRSEYAGAIWLEVMVVAGLTDDRAALGDIARQALRLRPDRLHLNTPARPSQLGSSGAVPRTRLESFCSLFTPPAVVVADVGEPDVPTTGTEDGLQDRLLALLARRPCTVEDASRGLSAPPNAVVKSLSALERAGRVHTLSMEDRLFFVKSANGGST